MTRLELLILLIAQARQNGFKFKDWYTTRIGLSWQSPRHAAEILATERRYYALLFSHDFARMFWKAGEGEKITFQVAASTFQRTLPDGSIGVVTRKPFTKRSARADVWKWHLRQLAMAEEPLRYMRRYLRVEDDVSDES